MRLRAILAISTLALAVTACEPANVVDVKGVESVDPDSIVVFANIDSHPNIARVCLDGVAFATTSRDHLPVLRVPEWDGSCAR